MTRVSAMVTHNTDIRRLDSEESRNRQSGQSADTLRSEGNGWVTEPVGLRCETSRLSLSQERSPHSGARIALRKPGNLLLPHEFLLLCRWLALDYPGKTPGPPGSQDTGNRSRSQA